MTNIYFSDRDKINVVYYPTIINNKTSDKIFTILEQNLEYLDEENSKIKIHGKEVVVPRKIVGYGEPGTKYNFSGTSVAAKDWTGNDRVSKVIQFVKRRVESFTNRDFNFVLVTRYTDGSQYIGWHRDKEDDLEDNPHIVGVSFGAERDFMFKPKDLVPKDILVDRNNNLELKVGHGSIICMNHPTNTYWYHSVPKRASIKKPRISLTFRKIKLV